MSRSDAILSDVQHKPSRSEYLSIRRLNLHVRHWGNNNAPMLFMLHGWMDMSASFQFVVDCLQQDWHVIAPDWRGFGLSAHAGRDGYWFPDYLADLDAIIEHYSPENPILLIGHSLGANVALMYAGIRPERIARLVNLEGFGMRDKRPDEAPENYKHWLEQLRTGAKLNDYASLNDVILRLQKTNPRLKNDRAAFLAKHWAIQNAQGRWQILADPLHKNRNPVLFKAAEMLSCWQRISAPVLWVEATDTWISTLFGNKDEARKEFDRRRSAISNVHAVEISNAGHMLHHDQPELLAGLIEQFLAAWEFGGD